MALTFARRQYLSRFLRLGRIALPMGVIGIFALAVVAQCASPERPSPAAEAPAPDRVSIYNPKADAKAEIEAAVKSAKIERMRVLVVFGGNRCDRCYQLHDLFKGNKEIAMILRSEFLQVLVDVDTQQKAFDQYVKKSEQRGVPLLSVLDSNGKVLVNQETGGLETGALEDGPKPDPKKVKAFLEKWSLAAVDAEKVFADGLAQAKSESKRILLHVGPPRIVWSRLLDQFFDENASLFTSDFVNLQIDQERMTNGRQLVKRLRPEKSFGFPWMAILDADGKTLVTSDAPSSGNIGFPINPGEIGHFMEMLHKTIQRTTPDQLAAIEKKLNEGRKHVPRGVRVPRTLRRIWRNSLTEFAAGLAVSRLDEVGREETAAPSAS
jgi:thioredoxin-related protein